MKKDSISNTNKQFTERTYASFRINKTQEKNKVIMRNYRAFMLRINKIERPNCQAVSPLVFQFGRCTSVFDFNLVLDIILYTLYLLSL